MKHIWFLLALLCLLAIVLDFAFLLSDASPFSLTNEWADPSVWIAPGPVAGLESSSSKLDDDGYVYKEDPCVEAMRGAMALMEQFMPDDTLYQRISSKEWKTTAYWTTELMSDYASAQRVWAETKLQCWRH